MMKYIFFGLYISHVVACNSYGKDENQFNHNFLLKEMNHNLRFKSSYKFTKVVSKQNREFANTYSILDSSEQEVLYLDIFKNTLLDSITESKYMKDFALHQEILQKKSLEYYKKYGINKFYADSIFTINTNKGEIIVLKRSLIKELQVENLPFLEKSDYNFFNNEKKKTTYKVSLFFQLNKANITFVNTDSKFSENDIINFLEVFLNSISLVKK